MVIIEKTTAIDRCDIYALVTPKTFDFVLTIGRHLLLS